MSIVIVVQGLLAIAAIITTVLLVEQYAADPRRGGNPDRRDLPARLARAWAACVQAHEIVGRRMCPWEGTDDTDRVIPGDGPPSATSRSARAGGP